MKFRPFGNTGMNVSEIGLGAWQLANPDWGVDSKSEGLRIIQKSLEAGCNFFDTAPGYGGGRSEELLGEDGNRYVRMSLSAQSSATQQKVLPISVRTQFVHPWKQACVDCKLIIWISFSCITPRVK